MKYRDLIEKLTPYADEEINMTVTTETVPEDPHDTTGENWNEVTVDTLRFFRNTEDCNDLIVGCTQRYDEEFDNIGDVEVILPE